MPARPELLALVRSGRELGPRGDARFPRSSFSPALCDTFAVITRGGACLAPGVRELVSELEGHMRVVADEFTARAEQ
jgi:hypothetical protein